MRHQLVALLLASSASFAMAANVSTKSVATPAVSAVFTADKPYVMISPSNPTFTLKLKANPTTGYAWYLRDYDDDLIAPVKREFQKPDSKLAGAPGFDVWTFKVKPLAFQVPRQTAIRMVYARPFSGENVTPVMFTVSTTSATN